VVDLIDREVDKADAAFAQAYAIAQRISTKYK
jgi:hypothetical protein